MLNFLRSRIPAAGLAAAVVLLAAVSALQAHGQTTADGGADPTASIGGGRILLVLPFDNLADQASDQATNQPSPAIPAAQTPGQVKTQTNPDPATLDWIREAAPEILNSRFSSAGFLPLTREDRLYALDHLGLPETFEPSRATALRIAETLDANYILIGNYRVTGGTLTLQARIVDVSKLRLSDPITETGELSQLIPLLNSLAWQLTRKLDPSFGVAEETFRAAGSKVRLDAFEQYIRGLTERDTDERLRHLKKATDLSPDFTAAWIATGKLQFANQQYEQAAVSFSKVTRPSGSPDPTTLEAAFYRGLSLIFSGNYPRAEEAFAAVARVLPLPEVVNNEAVANSRRVHDATAAIALFRQAEAADPTDSDYHFNLAVSLHRHGDKSEALTELAQSLKLRPNDSEAKALEEAWKTDKPQPQSTSQSDGVMASQPEPLERIKRTYNGAAFRQASLMLDQVEAARLAALPGPQRAAKLSASARAKLDRGLLLEAESGYQAALAADDHSAQAHAGLAEVRERAGDIDAARKEAQAALDRQPNLDAYLVLARLDLAANHLPEAQKEAEEAVQLDNTSRAARDLRKVIETRIDSHSASDGKPAAAVKP
ncbi:tetratricopeptide repeat protein [Acidicapsa acidisoli]|uniref:tetratricopeptide repeat protein n=1 Tax=Acidicapsa acidisoli TaxID=1615681 RepID=UPI0021DFC66C|nr:tetratricopeptide repeat protein [Acidicapsa acidisoli]